MAERFGTAMTRKHRAVHRVVWPLLAVAVSFAFVMALVLRAPPAPDAAPPAQELRK
jgi:hypothetical protein